MLPTESLKYLGITLDSRLSWKPRINNLTKRLSRACGILSKLRHYTNKSVLKTVFNSIFQTHLIYSILNGGRASPSTIQPLIQLQNKAVKPLSFKRDLKNKLDP